jgi:hypothetical protein
LICHWGGVPDRDPHLFLLFRFFLWLCCVLLASKDGILNLKSLGQNLQVGECAEAVFHWQGLQGRCEPSFA